MSAGGTGPGPAQGEGWRKLGQGDGDSGIRHEVELKAHLTLPAPLCRALLFCIHPFLHFLIHLTSYRTPAMCQVLFWAWGHSREYNKVPVPRELDFWRETQHDSK